MQQRETYLTSL
ncbi:BnaC03g60220D [Brassica napus]|uniref:BnaC03g60220D protein n=1 Tax=Brassica napus TaxID=3708 RepID=A0A078FFU9_BRANA|nr:BnaC03g60220D [Brassica napus]